MVKINDDGTIEYDEDLLKLDSGRIRIVTDPTLIKNPINLDTNLRLNLGIRTSAVDFGLDNMIKTVPDPIEVVDKKQELLDVIHDVVEEEREELKKEIIKEIKNEIISKRKTKKTKSRTKRKSDMGTLSAAIEEIMDVLSNEVLPYTGDLKYLHRKNKDKARDITAD